MNTLIWICHHYSFCCVGIALLKYLVAPPLQMAAFLVLAFFLGVGLCSSCPLD